MRLFDSHAHVTSRKFDGDRDAVIARAREAGVIALVEVGCDVEESERAVALACAHPWIWASVGVHPHDAKTWSAEAERRLRALAKDPRVRALGETGLDFHYDLSPRDRQREAFAAQLALAQELDLPAVLHVREAHDEALSTLRAHRGPRLRGVAHCFSSGKEHALAYVELGFAISVGGLVTFKNAPEVREAAAAVPLEKLLLETDCPYMAPVPHRGKRCEPAMVAATCEAIARLRGLTPDELAEATTANAARLFGIDLTLNR